MSSKRQQTMAKMARERTVRERRERKLEKKQAAAAEKKARAAGDLPAGGEETYVPPSAEESYPAT
jgi:cell division protein FtsB